VNTGDQITISNANGTWWTPLDLGIARCPDGLIMFAGACVEGTGHTEPTDPLPTADHDSLIAVVASHYFDCGSASAGSPVVFTIPSGVSNANLMLQMNTPDTSGYGSVQFDISMCKAAASGPWTHTFDFALDTGGFVPYPSMTPNPAVWVPGSGWQSVHNSYGDANSHNRVYIQRAGITAFSITGFDCYFDLNIGASPLDPSEMGYQFATIDGGTHNDVLHYGSGYLTGTNQVEHSTAAHSSITEILLFMDCYNCSGTSCTAAGNATLRKLVVYGTGTDPF
jgi:hypothetical protein